MDVQVSKKSGRAAIDRAHGQQEPDDECRAKPALSFGIFNCRRGSRPLGSALDTRVQIKAGA